MADKPPPIFIRPESRPHPLRPAVPRIESEPERGLWRRYWDGIKDPDNSWPLRIWYVLGGLIGVGLTGTLLGIVALLVYAFSLRGSLPDKGRGP